MNETDETCHATSAPLIVTDFNVKNLDDFFQ